MQERRGRRLSGDGRAPAGSARVEREPDVDVLPRYSEGFVRAIHERRMDVDRASVATPSTDPLQTPHAECQIRAHLLQD